MERLTERTGEGQAIPRVDLRSNGHKKCMERLAEYEDTGLMPEEIMDGKLLAGWIPVEERLPLGDFEEYIVTIKGDVKPTSLCYGGYGRWYDVDGNFYSVLAWMPLPEPYKPEK